MTSIYERVLAESEHLFAPARYDDPSSPATPSTEAPVIDLATIEQDVRERVEDGVAKGREILDEILPRIAKAAADAQADPLVQALENVADPEARALLTSLAQKLATVAAEVQAPPAEAAPAAPADMAMGVPVGPSLPPLAGPVVAGQA